MAGRTKRLHRFKASSSKDPKVLVENGNSPDAWMSVLDTQLPNAPDLKIYSINGAGMPTEFSSMYKVHKNLAGIDAGSVASSDADKLIIPISMDTSVNGIDKESGCEFHSGICYVDGDWVVPAISLSYPGLKLWRQALYNPHGVQVISREYTHAMSPKQPVDHGRILQNDLVISDLLKIVTGSDGLYGLPDQIELKTEELIKHVQED